ncbi:MAG: hypothetical protein M1822_001330 [Bathelium mastoideum]|nr:MAG: hypothetical protein M1822_001330 [Bathelium mastoideum]
MSIVLPIVRRVTHSKPRTIAVEPSTSDDCTTVDGTPDVDSGYATAVANTPETSESGHDGGDEHCSPTPGSRVGSIQYPAGASEDLKLFEKQLDEATWNRFRDVSDRIQMPLLSHVQKSSKKYKPMALRLAVLGRTQEDARPRIVVLCDPKASKRVKKFFEQVWVKELCQPNDQVLPSLEAVVIGRSPQLRMSVGSVRVYGGVNPNGRGGSTLCGTPIKLSLGEAERIATLGGCIKVNKSDGSFEIYGMTAGHTLDDLLGVSSDEYEASSCQEESDISSSEDEEDDIGIGLLQPPTWSMSNLSLDEPLQGLSKRVPETWISLGSSLSLAPTKASAVRRYLDWSLIRMEDIATIKPNLLRDVEKVEKYRSGDLTMPAGLNGNHHKRNVVMMSGLEGLKEGSLSASFARVILGAGQEFIDVHLLTLGGNKEIIEGDSGSWVIDGKTGEVFGHVVASDAFGDGYVVPIQATFCDIATRLNAVSVDLPTTVDIASLVFDNAIEMEAASAFSLPSISILNDPQQLETLSPPPHMDSGYSSAQRSPPQIEDPDTEKETERSQELGIPFQAESHGQDHTLYVAPSVEEEREDPGTEMDDIVVRDITERRSSMSQELLKDTEENANAVKKYQEMTKRSIISATRQPPSWRADIKAGSERSDVSSTRGSVKPDGSIRFRVGTSSGIEFSGDLEGRTIHVVHEEGTMADVVIGTTGRTRERVYSIDGGRARRSKVVTRYSQPPAGKDAHKADPPSAALEARRSRSADTATRQPLATARSYRVPRSPPQIHHYEVRPARTRTSSFASSYRSSVRSNRSSAESSVSNDTSATSVDDDDDVYYHSRSPYSPRYESQYRGSRRSEYPLTPPTSISSASSDDCGPRHTRRAIITTGDYRYRVDAGTERVRDGDPLQDLEHLSRRPRSYVERQSERDDGLRKRERVTRYYTDWEEDLERARNRYRRGVSRSRSRDRYHEREREYEHERDLERFKRLERARIGKEGYWDREESRVRRSRDDDGREDSSITSTREVVLDTVSIGADASQAG